MGIFKRNIKHTDEMPNNCAHIALSYVIMVSDWSVHSVVLAALFKKNARCV